MLLHAIENQIFSKAAPQAIRHLTKPDLATQDPAARAVLDQAKIEFQVAPPLTIHLSDPDLLAGVWHATREVYVVDPKQRAMREAVAWAVSKTNECPYCVTVHSGMYASAGGTKSKTTETSAWAAASQTRDAPEHKALSIPANLVAQVYGTAALYHYINRMVSVFLDERPVVIPGAGSVVGQRLVRASFKILGKRMVSQDPVPGQSAVRADGVLPDAFDWAKESPAIAAALAHFANAAENAGLQAVSSDVRGLVTRHLSDWEGEAPPLSRNWLEAEVDPLEAKDRPAARLALLTARAAWQVDNTLIAEFRAQNPDEKALLQTIAWASFAATLQIASWWYLP